MLMTRKYTEQKILGTCTVDCDSYLWDL